MKITSVRIKKTNSDATNTVLGIASVEFDNCFILHGLKLVQLPDKRIVSFPNRKVKKYSVDDKGFTQNFGYTDIAHPSTREFRQYIEEELFKIYDSEIKNKEEN